MSVWPVASLFAQGHERAAMSTANDTPQWLSRPERGSERWLRLMTWLSFKVGRDRARWLLYPIAAWFWLRTPHARRDSRQYLNRILDHPAGPRDTFAHYLTFAATILDRLYLLRGQRELFDIEVHGRELLFRHLRDGRGVFMVGAHMGSFESLRVMSREQQQWQVSMAMFEDNAQRIGALLRTIDPKLTEMIVPLGQIDSMLKIQARLDRGDMVGFLADRSVGNDPVEMVPFLGAPAPFPTGVFRMAAVLRRPVLGIAGLYLGDNRYRLHFVELADFSNTPRSDRREAIAAAVHTYAATLESFCREAPLNWFNFFDFWAPRAQGEAVSNTAAPAASAATSATPERPRS